MRFLSDAFRDKGCRFTLVTYEHPDPAALADGLACIAIGPAGFADASGAFAERWGAQPGSAFLLRPDGYVASRMKHPTSERIKAALRRACALAA